MKKGRFSPGALGVHFGPCSVRIVALERNRKGIQLKQCCEKSFPDDVRFLGVFDGDVKSSCIQALQSLVSDCRLRNLKATVGIDSRTVFMRRIPVDSWLEGEALQDQVLWEAEQLLVDPLDRYVIDFHVQYSDGRVREVLLAAVRHNVLHEYIEIIKKSGLEPVCVDVDLFALSNAYEQLSGERVLGPTALIDIEPGCVRFVVVYDGRFNFGKNFEMSPDPSELVKIFDTVYRGGGAPPLAKVVLSGSGALSEGLLSDLTARWDHSVEVADPHRGLQLASSLPRQQYKRGEPAYMIGLGLALRGVTES
jgi:type IV pilus assembly protein PilM